MAEETKEQSCAEFALFVTLKIIGVLVALYFFLAGLSLMGGSLVLLGAREQANSSRSLIIRLQVSWWEFWPQSWCSHPLPAQV